MGRPKAVITIDAQTQKKIQSFKDRLLQMSENDEVSETHKKVIDFIFNKLDPCSVNILIAYYEFGQSPSTVAKYLGVPPYIVASRIKRIITKCKSSI